MNSTSFTRLALLLSFSLTLMLGGCVLESESPILQEEAAGPGAGAPPDISGTYQLGTEPEGDDKLVLRRKEGSRNAFIADNGGPEKSILILAAPLRAPGTMLLQIADPDKGRIALIPARLTAEELTFYPQAGLESKPGPAFSFTTVLYWNKGFWQWTAQKHRLPLAEDHELNLLLAGTNRESLLAAMDDMFIAGAFGKGETCRRVRD